MYAKNEKNIPNDLSGSNKVFTLLSLFLLIALCVSVYSNSLQGQFLLDDPVFIVENSYIRDLSSVPKLFLSAIGAGSGSDFGYYRPLQMVSYAIVYNFWQLNVQAYHILNIILHIFTVLSLYWMITILFEDRVLSLFTSILYAVHPVHAESVAYISGTGDCLAGLFLILSFIFYVKLQKTTALGTFLLFFMSYFLALFSKENSLILPALALLYHAAFKRRVKIPVFLTTLLMSAGYLAFRFFVGEGPAMDGMSPADILSRVPGVFASITGYLKILFFPLGLNMGHDSVFFAFTDPPVILGIFLSVILLFFAFKERGAGLIFFAVFWFFLTLLPSSNLYPVAFYMADHYLYLPSIGFFLVIGGVLRSTYSQRKYRIYSLLALLSLAGLYGYLTAQQNSYWRSSAFFCERTLKYNPSSFRALNNMGRQYETEGRLQDAEIFYKKALEAHPHKEAYNNLGNVYVKLGRNAEAVAMYEKALELGPGYAKAFYNLASEYAKVGKAEDSEALYKRALENNPNLVEAYCGLGALYGETGRAKDAVELYEKALKLSPSYAAAYTGLGNVYAASGEYDKALDSYEKALKEDPNDANAYNNIGNIKAIYGKYDEAVKLYRKAIEVDPDFAGAYYNLARLDAVSGKTEEALANYNKVIEKDPNFGDAYVHMSILYYLNAQYDMAIKYYDLAAERGFKVPRDLAEKLETQRK